MPTNGAADERAEDLHDSCDESEDEQEILEESPCGRWQKRRVKVTQRDVPGIDVAYLAMDTEDGVEVVWNEVQFSARRVFKEQEEKIRVKFDNLIGLEHCNIVKFHKYWADIRTEVKPRVIFITEYMSSGSLRQFLKRIKKDKRNIQEKSWKRWCTQILSALSYLHTCDPPIIHGNLTTDTIFIQHNGLIKIGSVAPDAIHNHVKTYREEQRNMHYIAPEYGEAQDLLTTGVDIYAFGICALEMAVLEIQTNGDNKHISREAIEKSIDQLEDPLQRDFIRKCVGPVPQRPLARELLFHNVLFEVHSLKLLSAHCYVQNENVLDHADNTLIERLSPETVIASIEHPDGVENVQWKVSQVPALEIEKFIEEVKNGVYPLTAYALPEHPAKTRPQTPETAESVKSTTPEPVEVESRAILRMQCETKEEEEGKVKLELLLRMDDKMNRQLSCEIGLEDSPWGLANELVEYGFINDTDRIRVAALIEEKLNIPTNQSSGLPVSVNS
ncbi:nuclear receptor-binding protein-like [Asterias rubens]|uniref:nuclear receptor-binding protein-like n=1 Tax=Asterias rubens TaxID=7604 RepID=UPI00145563FB|nr:nuclear receptor-binding protein-like [Asterias rubens]